MIHLHCHTTYSFLDGFGTPTQVAARVADLGHKAGAVTDHGNLVAHAPWERAAKKAGIKPIYGCEFYIVDNLAVRAKHQPSLGASAFPHVTVLAATEAGYRNLLKLNRLAWTDGFYYKPRVDWATLARHQEGLIVLSGCVGGYPSRLINGEGGASAAYDFLAARKKELERFVVELIPEPGLDISETTTEPLIRLATDLGLPMVLTADAHFPRPEDHAAQDLLLAVGTRQIVNDPKRNLQLPAYQYCCDDLDLIARAKLVAPTIGDEVWRKAIDTSVMIGDACNVELPRAKRVTFPGVTVGESSEAMLWRWVVEGVVARQSQFSAPSAIYAERAKREYLTLKRKGFCDYVLIVADVCRHLKSRGVLTTLRGSAGGCLLLWLVGGSELDPIRHDLSFERFYDESRPDPPDVDIDVERAYRQVAIDYLYDKYGHDRCSQIAALAQLKAKSALQDACRGLGISRAEFSPLSAALDVQDEDMDRQLEEVTDPAALAVLRDHPELAGYVKALVGQYRQASIHAAGVLIADRPLDEVVGILRGAGGQVVAAVDKRDAAALGFLKIDLLSVAALDVMAGACRRLGKDPSWLTTLPLDDEATLATGAAGQLAGIFQLEGAAAARVSRQIGLATFDDVAAAGALCRPGPGDWVATYEEHKREPEIFERYLAQVHPIAAAIIRPTYGVLIYQEQVMALAKELANLPWADVHKLRKGIVDKLGLNPNTGAEWQAEWRGKFIKGCLAQGVTSEEAEFWWISMESHGGYSFNRAHCYAYALLGYWLLYLKTHHPDAFYETYLRLESDPVKLKRLLAEYASRGGSVEVLDYTQVRDAFYSPRPGRLVGGLSNLRGVGPTIATKVLKREFDFSSWDELLAALPSQVAASLRKAGVPNGTIVDPQELLWLAPWAPVTTVGAEEKSYRERWGLSRVGDLPPGEMVDGDVAVAGYVTAGVVNAERVMLRLEDETGGLMARVPMKTVASVWDQYRGLTCPDFIAATGWWSGDALYLRGAVVLKRRPTPPPSATGRAAKDALAALLPPLPDWDDVPIAASALRKRSPIKADPRGAWK